MAYLTSQHDRLGLSADDIRNSIVTDQYTDSHTGMTHIYLRQQLNGLPVVNANASIHVAADGRVLTASAAFVPGLSGLENTSAMAIRPDLTAAEALEQAAGDLGLPSSAVAITVPAAADDLFQTTTLTSGPLSLDPIPAKLEYVATATGVELAWDIVLRTPDGQHWYDAEVHGSTGDLLFANDWVDEASYNVFARPTESPIDGTRSVVVNPNDPTVSPYGWHDTNGAAGAEFTDTRGNNVFAQDDWNDDDSGGARPDGGAGLNFDFPLDLTQDPHQYVDAAVTNLFYWNNVIHDLHYKYGFTEAAGNFQQTNYTGFGLGNDPVQADAQDGGGMDNANFATPPDGIAPRMQMYEFDLTATHRDGDLQSEIMVHEYGHGVSNRLVGGPSNVNALFGLQSGGMGEGWGDWWGLMFTQKTTDAKMDAYPVGNWVLGQTPSGGGVRRYPYSFDMTVDPLTYGRYNGGFPNNEVHNSGEIWATVLWDLNWLLIDKYGFNPNLAGGYTGPGSAGNILALQLVMDSLKLMPVNPTFLDGRNAVLLADQVLTGGANDMEIWTAFARRGMGLSAFDGGFADATTVVEAFDMPNFNLAPILNAAGSMTLRTVHQEDVTNFGTRISTMLQSLGTDPITDPNANAQEGVAVVAASTTQGAWQYTTNNGATWKALGNVSEASARLLAANTATRIRFLPKPGFVGQVSPAIFFRAWDQTSGVNGGTANVTTNGGRTAFSSAIASASITVAPVKHAPVLNTSVALSLSTIDENVADAANTGTLLQTILASGGTPAITDADAGDPQGIAVTGADETHGFWQYWLNSVLQWQNVADPATGSPSIAQALLLPSDNTVRLRFVPDPSFHGIVTGGISFRAWDQSDGNDPGTLADTRENGGQTAFSQDISSASITVTWINEAPVVDVGAELQMTPVNEDDVSNPGTLITDVLASIVPSPVTDNDADMSGAGIAVTQAEDIDGTWWYTTNGADWQPIAGAVSNTSARLLAADNATRLRFVPDPDFNTADGVSVPIPTITFRAWDRTTGTNGTTADASINGGSTAFSTGTGTVSVLVNSVNDAPRFVKGSDQSVLEDSGEQLVPGWATLLPPPSDEVGQAAFFDIVEIVADQPGMFEVEPAVDPVTGDLTYTPAPNAYGTATLSIQSRDYDANNNEAISAPQTFTITVEGINDPPSFVAGLDQAVDENAGAQVVSDWATDVSCGVGESGQALQFVVVENSNPALFAELPAISPDGELTYRTADNANGMALITVILQDDGGTANGGIDASDPQTFAIDVAPVNAKPVAVGQQLSVDANRSLTFTPVDDGDPEVVQTLTFTFTSDPTLGTITVNSATGELVYTPKPGVIRGTDRFTFTVTDDDTAGGAALTSDPATVQIRVDPVVVVPAGSGSNNLLLRLVNGKLRLDRTGTQTPLFNAPLAEVKKLTVLGSAANPDLLTVDFAGGNITLPSGLVFDGLSDGVDTLAVRGSSRGDAFVLESTRLTANGLSIPFQNVGQVKIDGGAGNDSYVVAALDSPLRIGDTSGVDQIDFSQWTGGSGITIDLGLSKGQPQQVSGVGRLALSGTIENVIGTAFADRIKGNASANRLSGGGGNDTLYGLGGNDLLFGDEGDDFLYAGPGADVLLGGLGKDTLTAGTGRAILIGGDGEDVLQGSTGESIFIGGTTKHDANDAALMAIASEWGSSRAFSTRVSRLRAGVGPNRVSLALNDTVFDDKLQDRMIGGSAREWFLAFTATDSVEKPGSGDITGA